MIAYFDESGKPESKPIVSIATLVAYDLKWQRFDANWRNTLERFKAAQHPKHKIRWFHMKEFDGPCNKPYCAWKQDKKNQLAASLATLTTQTIVFGASHSLDVNLWKELIVPDIHDPFERKRAWYLFLLTSLMEDIVRFVTVPPHEKITCVFDESKEYSSIAMEYFAELKVNRKWEHIFGSANYNTSCFYPGLQAADMVAYEGRRRIERDFVDNEKRPIRKLLISLMSENKLVIAHHDRVSLENYKDRSAAMKAQLIRMAQRHV